jgi:hypothetical protein
VSLTSIVRAALKEPSVYRLWLVPVPVIVLRSFCMTVVVARHPACHGGQPRPYRVGSQQAPSSSSFSVQHDKQLILHVAFQSHICQHMKALNGKWLMFLLLHENSAASVQARCLVPCTTRLSDPTRSLNSVAWKSVVPSWKGCNCHETARASRHVTTCLDTVIRNITRLSKQSSQSFRP